MSRRKPFAWTEGARLALDVVSVEAAPKKPKPFTPSEDHECVAFVSWLELQIAGGKPIKFSHLPLETYTGAGKGGFIVAARNKRLGVRKGVPDYLLIIRNKAHFIEMKRTEGGRVSVQQQAWIDALRMAGVGAHVCAGAREAKLLVTNLLAARD